MTGSLINKRNKIYVVLNVYDEFGKRHRKWILTDLTVKSGKKERDKVLRDIIAQYENIPQIAATKLLFADYVKVWLNEAKIKVDKVTYQHYENDANNHIIPYFKLHKTKLVDVTRQVLQSYFNQKHESGNLKTGGGLSAKSLRHHKNIIHQTLELAVLNNYIAENPCKSLTLPKLERNVYDFFTLEETKSFLQTVKNERLYPLYYLTAVYGLRRSEVLGLKWDSVDLKGKKLIIKHTRTRANEVIEKDKTKTKSSLRSFPLSAKFSAICEVFR